MGNLRCIALSLSLCFVLVLASDAGLDNFFPLLFEFPHQLGNLFYPGGQLHESCSQKGIALSKPQMWNMTYNCFVGAGDSNLDEEFVGYVDCIHGKISALADSCDLSAEESSFLRKALDSNLNVQDVINAADHREMNRQATPECTREVMNGKAKCTVENKYEDMKYDDEGCRAFQSYINCLNVEMAACGTMIRDVFVDMARAGFDATCAVN